MRQSARGRSNSVPNSWVSFFIKMFHIEKYSSTIKCDGIKVIQILYNKGLFIKNEKLSEFIKNGYLKKLLSENDKLKFLITYKKNFKKNKKLFKSGSVDLINTYPKRTRSQIIINTQFKAPSAPQSPVSPFRIILPEDSPKQTKYASRGAMKTDEEPERKGSPLANEQTTIPKLITQYKNKLWISFGINNYTHLPKLKNAVNDANDIAKFAQEKLYFNSTVYINEQVTKNNIEHIIKHQLYQTADTYDLIVISFHGHGVTLNIHNRKYGFIAPFDAPKNKTPANLISMEDLSNWTKYLKSNHILLYMDCCFSGFTALRSAEERQRRSSNFTKYSLDKYLKTKSRIVINAGTHDQKVADGGWNDNSIFTGAFMSFPGFMNTVGSVSSLYNYLLETVPRYHSQTPTMGKLIGDQGGDIFLGL